MLKKIFTAILLLSLAACGFRVIYEERTDVVSYAIQLASIRIKKERTQISQELKNNLYDLLNPDYLKVEPKYFLSMKVQKTVTPTFITSTGASGRNKITINITYTLQNIETAAFVSQGSTSVNDNYDVSINRYGTYVADETVSNNLTRIAAQNIRNSLVNDLIEVKKKCEEALNPKEKVAGEEEAAEEDLADFVCPLDSGVMKEDAQKKLAQ